MSLPGSVIPWIDLQFHDDNGTPLAGGFVEFFVAGSATHKDTFSQADLSPTSVNANPLTLDAGGRAPIFLETGGYDVTVKDRNGVLVQTVSGVEDIGATFLNTLGGVFTSGARNVTSGYTVLATDYFLTVNSTGGPNPCIINLPAVATRLQSINIKQASGTNGELGIQITPNGADTIEGDLATFTINASTGGPTYPSVWLAPDSAASTWRIIASHGM